MAAILNLGVTAILDFKIDDRNESPISKLVLINPFFVIIACLHDFQYFARLGKRPFWKTSFLVNIAAGDFRGFLAHDSIPYQEPLCKKSAFSF